MRVQQSEFYTADSMTARFSWCYDKRVYTTLISIYVLALRRLCNHMLFMNVRLLRFGVKSWTQPKPNMSIGPSVSFCLQRTTLHAEWNVLEYKVTARLFAAADQLITHKTKLSLS